MQSLQRRGKPPTHLWYCWSHPLTCSTVHPPAVLLCHQSCKAGLAADVCCTHTPISLAAVVQNQRLAQQCGSLHLWQQEMRGKACASEVHVFDFDVAFSGNKCFAGQNVVTASCRFSLTTLRHLPGTTMAPSCSRNENHRRCLCLLVDTSEIAVDIPAVSTGHNLCATVFLGEEAVLEGVDAGM